MQLAIKKCHGSSNDFVLLDERTVTGLTDSDRSALALLLCNRRGVLGADGVLFVQTSNRADARMRMFNPDGSEPQTCGNGLRCVARYVSEQLASTDLVIETMLGVATAKEQPEMAPGVRTFSVQMGPFSLAPGDLPLRIDGPRLVNARLPALDADLIFTAISAPNPHLITLVERMDRKRLESIGRRASALPELLPERANVSFCHVLDDESLAVMTFERGAGITLSCGSGMASSALAACIAGLARWDCWLTVYSEGGFVKAFVRDNNGSGYDVSLNGNATFVFDGTINVDLAAGTLDRVMSGTINVDEIAAYSHVQESAELVMRALGSP